MHTREAADRFKYALKCAISYVLFGLGLLHLWKRISLDGRAVVLTYHRVLDRDAMAESWSHPAIVVSPDVFERQMRVLARSFRVLRLSEFESHLRSGQPFKSASCLVTFDDGWKETYTEAWPVLRRLDLPATVFLPVQYIGSDNVFWQERLGWLLFDAWQRARSGADGRSRVAQALTGTGFEGVLELNPDTAKQSIVDLVRAKKAEEGWNPNAVLEALAGISADRDRPATDRFMSWDNVKKMSAGGVTFGAHGETHRILTSLTPAELDREMTVSRQTLEAALGCECSSVSYPNGNWNSTVTAAAERAGFSLGFSMIRGRVSSRENHFLVRRVNIFDDVTRNQPMFLARVLGVF
jgi:peptidoglycan/xylan/chitin deacetylase (PgdA/CDA1 family)